MRKEIIDSGNSTRIGASRGNGGRNAASAKQDERKPVGPDVFFRQKDGDTMAGMQKGESGHAMEGVQKSRMTPEKINEFLKKNPFLGC